MCVMCPRMFPCMPAVGTGRGGGERGDQNDGPDLLETMAQNWNLRTREKPLEYSEAKTEKICELE